MKGKMYRLTLMVCDAKMLEEEVTFKIDETDSRRLQELKVSIGLLDEIDEFRRRHCKVDVVEVERKEAGDGCGHRIV